MQADSLTLPTTGSPAEPQRCKRCGRALSALASTTRNVGPVCEGHDGYIISPFVIVADSNEQSGRWEFAGLTEDASRGAVEIIPQITTRALYRDRLADYTVQGMEWMVQVERKTLGDFFGSITHRRSRFEGEIAYLDKHVATSFVIVEAEWTDVFAGTPRMQNDPAKVARLAKGASRTVISWSLKYPRVHWLFCAGRGHAEAVCYRTLEKAWVMEMERRKG